MVTKLLSRYFELTDIGRSCKDFRSVHGVGVHPAFKIIWYLLNCSQGSGIKIQQGFHELPADMFLQTLDVLASVFNRCT